MNFTPDTTLTIRNQHHTFVINDRNTIDQDESGGRAVIYQIRNTTHNTIHALKVFKDGFRESYNSRNFTFFQTALTDIPGFEWVPQRLLINPNDDKALLDQHPYLENAIVMPWFALPKLDEIRGFIKKKQLTNISSKSKQFASLFAYALAELENRGIAHGDIATSNVFFDWDNDRLVIIDIEDMFHKSLVRPSHLENAVGGTPNYRFSTQFTSWQPSADRFAGAIMISEILTLADDKCIQASASETYFDADDIANREWGDPVSRYPIMSEALDDINAKASEYLKTCWNAKATEIDKLPKLSEWRDALGKPSETLITRLLNQFSSPTPAPVKPAPAPVKPAPAPVKPAPAPVKPAPAPVKPAPAPVKPAPAPAKPAPAPAKPAPAPAEPTPAPAEPTPAPVKPAPAPVKMNFTPATTLTIGNQHYTFVMNDRNTIDQDESGGRAVIYKILNTTHNTIHALKVFKDGFRESYNSKNFAFFQTALTDVPGFEWVPQRLLINSNDDKALLDQHPYLENAIVMPWFALPKLDEIRSRIKKKQLTNITSKSKQFASLFAYALAELENRGIAHGDIATSNVFFDWDNDRLVIIDIEDMFHTSLVRPRHLENAVGGTPNYRFSTQFTSWQPSADRFAGAVMISEILTLADAACIQASARETYFDADDIANREANGIDVPRFITIYEALDDINAKASKYLKTCWNAKANEIDKLPKLSEWRDALGKPSETLITRLLNLFSSPAPTPAKPAPVQTEPVPAPIPQRPAKTPYERKADSDFPTLIVFMLDLSRSMFEYKIGADYRIDVACNLINNIIETLVNRALKNSGVKPRYHVAVLGYHKNTAHILQGELVQSMYNTGVKMIDNNGANVNDGIYPLGIFDAGANPINQASINEVICAGAGMKDFPDGETHMTQAFEKVYELLNRNIERYANCHPPYIFHITDGANNDGKNPQAYTDKIKQLTTEYGNVLISTAYIGQGLIANQGDARAWPGITDNTHFTGDRADWARGLRALSSRMPAPYHAILTGKKEFVTESDKTEVFTTYPKLSSEAYLFFPGDNPEMLRLAMAASVSTGTTGK
jgi:serine/threonine protein kinase